jgi:2-methylcitrate dehydratase PrpD
MPTIVQQLAEYASNLRYEDLPPAVIERAKICMLDLIGIALAGSKRENTALARKVALSIGAPGSATAWVNGEKLRAADAAMVNSVASHCMLQDDWLPRSHSHVGAVVIPTTLAIGEESGAGGKELIAAIVAGYDVEDRIGSLSVPAFTRGFRVSGVYSYFGAATVTARLYGLNPEQTAAAIACAASMCGGVLQPWTDGTMEWSFQEGFGARGGILCATLARDGLQGSPNIFEGPNGVNRCFSGGNDDAGEITAELGSLFRISETCYKRFPTGGANQGSATLAHTLRARHTFDYKNIAKVIVELPRNGTHERMNYAGIPYAGPFTTIDQCLISKPFAIAAILKTGDLTVESLVDGVNNRELLALAARIELREVDDLTGWNMRMSIQMQDGKRFDGDGRDIDMAQVHLGWKDACEKFLKTADRIIGVTRAAQLIDRIGSLENVAGAAEIATLIQSGAAPLRH